MRVEDDGREEREEADDGGEAALLYRGRLEKRGGWLPGGKNCATMNVKGEECSEHTCIPVLAVEVNERDSNGGVLP